MLFRRSTLAALIELDLGRRLCLTERSALSPYTLDGGKLSVTVKLQWTSYEVRLTPLLETH